MKTNKLDLQVMKLGHAVSMTQFKEPPFHFHFFFLVPLTQLLVLLKSVGLQT